jgi:Flp pilus assembly protein TadD
LAVEEELMWLALALLYAGTAADSYQQGAAAIQRGAAAEAIKPLSRAVQLEPKNALYRKALGVAYAAQELYREAEEQFGEACRLDRGLPDVCYYHARALYALNRFEPAIEILGKLQAKKAREFAALAQAEEASGRIEDAERDYKKACQSAGASPAGTPEPPCLLYGVFLFRQGRMTDALQQLQLVANDHPKHPRVQFELGRVLYQAGELQAAVKHLSTAVTLGYGEGAALLLDKARRRLNATAPPAP